MELIDVLDKNGKFIGEVKTREEVHRLGFWHRTVHIWIVNNKKELLIQKRAVIKDQYPNMWDISVGGHVRSGQGSINTAIDEAREELGMILAESDFHYLFTSKSQSRSENETFVNNEFSDVYLVEMDKNINDFKLQVEEVAEVKFINIFELREIIKDKDNNFVRHDEEYRRLFQYIEDNFQS